MTYVEFLYVLELNLDEPQLVGDIKCEICELIIQGLDNIVIKNASDEKINATIYTLCGDLPGSARAFVSNSRILTIF